MKRVASAIASFERAAVDMALMGEIPLIGQDHEEQAAIDHERRRRKTNYTKAYRRLERMMGGV